MGLRLWSSWRRSSTCRWGGTRATVWRTMCRWISTVPCSACGPKICAIWSAGTTEPADDLQVGAQGRAAGREARACGGTSPSVTWALG